MPTTPPSLTPTPTPAPQRGDRSTFKDRVDAFITWMVTAVTEFGALAANVYANAVSAFNSASTATSQAAAAVASVNALPWSSGTYSVGDVRYSTVDGRTYRCYVGLASTTDPALDRTHWVCISAGPLQYLHVRDQKSANAPGGANAGVSSFTQRDLNTTVGSNSIIGASLSSNQVTLPAGTYEVIASSPAYRVNSHRVSLYNVTDSADIIQGDNAQSGTGDDSMTRSNVQGRFTLTATKVIALRHFMRATNGTADMGFAVNNGQPEIYSSMQLWKID